MPNFVYDKTGSYGSLTQYLPKLTEAVSTGSAQTTVSASEWNGVAEGLLSVAYGITTGSLFGFVRTSSAPTASVGQYSDFIWMSSSGDLMLHKRNNTDSFISGVIPTPANPTLYYQVVNNDWTSSANNLSKLTMSFDSQYIEPSDKTGMTQISFGAQVVTLTGTNSLTNKTIVTPVLTGSVSGDFSISSSLRIRRDDVVINTSGTYGLQLENLTSAASGSNKLSPALNFYTQAFSASVAQDVKMSIQALPLQRTSDPDVSIVIYSSVNNATPQNCLEINSSGITASLPISPLFGAKTIDPNWTNVTYQNSYVDFGAGYPTSSFWKDPAGIVHVRLAAASGTNGATIFTLPAGYRPAYQLIFPGYVDNSSTYSTLMFFIKTNGDVLCATAAGNIAALFNVSFPGEL